VGVGGCKATLFLLVTPWVINSFRGVCCTLNLAANKINQHSPAWMGGERGERGDER